MAYFQSILLLTCLKFAGILALKLASIFSRHRERHTPNEAAASSELPRHLFILVVEHLLEQQTDTFGNKDGILGILTDRGCLKLKALLINWNTELEPTVWEICEKKTVCQKLQLREIGWLLQGH